MSLPSRLLRAAWRWLGSGYRRPEAIDPSGIVRDRLVLVALADDHIADAVSALGARDLLVLDRAAAPGVHRQQDRCRQPYTRIPDIRKNNCRVALLHGRSAFGLWQKRQFANFDFILVPVGPLGALAMRLALLRYERRGVLTLAGATRMGGGSGRDYWVLTACVRLRDRARHYAPSGSTPLELVQGLAGIDYVLLRSFNAIAAGMHRGDIDLLVAQHDVAACKQRLDVAVGTQSFDLFTDQGQDGYSYKSVPYYSPRLAAEVLRAAELTAEGLRVPSPRWCFIAYCYDLLFHHKLCPEAAAGEKLEPHAFMKAKHHAELARLATAAEQSVPTTVSELEQILRTEGVMPSIDLIGFYSNGCGFLSRRYFGKARLKPGLATFFIRDFGTGLDRLPELRQRLGDTFEIIAEGPLEPKRCEQVFQSVRGGNWLDIKAPGGEARPIYWFVCWDAAPQPPSPRTRRKHPRVDNENIRFKDDLRRELSPDDVKALRIIHSSDNSDEALDHLEHLGLLDHPELRRRLSGLKA